MTAGAIVLVGTPIGNLSDLSPGAVDALRGAEVIACEDTRRTRALLSHAGIPTPRLVVLNERTEARAVGELVRRAGGGESVAVVSDAGMPGVSDPGERLVAAAIDAGVTVRAIPGPSAVLAALVVSGLPTGRFCFEGFLPRKGAARRERLAAVGDERRTAVLFEAPHRVRQTVGELVSVCGPDRRVALARELTKTFEEVWRGTLLDAAAWLAGREPRGEYTLVLAGAAPAAAATESDIEAALRHELASGVSKRDAVASVASALEVPRRRVYDLATKLG